MNDLEKQFYEDIREKIASLKHPLKGVRYFSLEDIRDLVEEKSIVINVEIPIDQSVPEGFLKKGISGTIQEYSTTSNKDSIEDDGIWLNIKSN